MQLQENILSPLLSKHGIVQSLLCTINSAANPLLTQHLHTLLKWHASQQGHSHRAQLQIHQSMIVCEASYLIPPNTKSKQIGIAEHDIA